jgi:hypothetical protein
LDDGARAGDFDAEGLITPLGEPSPGVCGGGAGAALACGAAGLARICGEDPWTTWARGGAPGDEPDSAGRFGANRYPQTPQNRAFGSSGELQDGHVIPPNFRRTIQTWHATFQRKSS